MIKPERLKKNQIWTAAERFRKEYVDPIELVPVPILEILEVDLEVQPVPVPGLLEKVDIDGFISRDLDKVYVDETIYTNEKYENRLRFTYAHEVGHLVLHEEQIRNCQFSNLEEWVQIRESMPEEDLEWFEWQAREFGGRLLVPKDRLIHEIEIRRELIDRAKKKMDSNHSELIIDYISIPISRVFQVSEQVISRRIQYENVWTELEL